MSLLPFIGRLIVPCDEYGVPSDEHSIEFAQWETRAWVFAWLGRFAAFAYGDVMPRALDTRNPRSFMGGDWSA